LRFSGDDLPAWGRPISKGGREVGVATCSALSPRFGPLGQAIVETASAQEGKHLQVLDQGKRFAAEVVRTPLYDPGRKRVRA